jgi:hypothetical protein
MVRKLKFNDLLKSMKRYTNQRFTRLPIAPTALVERAPPEFDKEDDKLENSDLSDRKQSEFQDSLSARQ